MPDKRLERTREAYVTEPQRLRGIALYEPANPAALKAAIAERDGWTEWYLKKAETPEK